jgi:hypothetical protein
VENGAVSFFTEKEGERLEVEDGSDKGAHQSERRGREKGGSYRFRGPGGPCRIGPDWAAPVQFVFSFFFLFLFFLYNFCINPPNKVKPMSKIF